VSILSGTYFFSSLLDGTGTVGAFTGPLASPKHNTIHAMPATVLTLASDCWRIGALGMGLYVPLLHSHLRQRRKCHTDSAVKKPTT